jgi:hypothetical protein
MGDYWFQSQLIAHKSKAPGKAGRQTLDMSDS